MTPNKEDYLKTIYQAQQGGKPVPNKLIANTLGISGASVTEMLIKLSSQGLINYESYKGSTLTEEGIKSCIGVVRSHKLWEVFLIKYLKYSLSDAHEDAELLEHATTDRMIDRLDEFLGYPEVCPHGSFIPRTGSKIIKRELIKMSELKKGEKFIIRQFSEEKELLDYLEMIGIALGSECSVEKIGEYEGPITLNIDGNEVQISYKAACKLLVEKT